MSKGIHIYEAWQWWWYSHINLLPCFDTMTYECRLILIALYYLIWVCDHQMALPNNLCMWLKPVSIATLREPSIHDAQHNISHSCIRLLIPTQLLELHLWSYSLVLRGWDVHQLIVTSELVNMLTTKDFLCIFLCCVCLSVDVVRFFFSSKKTTWKYCLSENCVLICFSLLQSSLHTQREGAKP